MKKIVGHRPKSRLRGLVEKDGVGFLPEMEVGPFLIQTPGYFASSDEEGNINSCIFSMNPYGVVMEETPSSKMDGKINSQSKLIMVIAIIAVVSFMAMMVVSADWINANIWISTFATIAYLAFIVLLLPKAFNILLRRLSKDQEIREFSKYLGAKNAVENAYYDLGRAPNSEEVKEYSIYSSECKYTKNSYIACLALVISCVHFLDGVWYWIAIVLAAVVMCTLEWKNHLVFWQALVVSVPDEKHYKAAIMAMEETAELIDSMKVQYHEFEGKPDSENFDEKRCEGCPAYDFCQEINQGNVKEDKDED